jgi:hypothetical protein
MENIAHMEQKSVCHVQLASGLPAELLQHASHALVTAQQYPRVIRRQEKQQNAQLGIM